MSDIVSKYNKYIKLVAKLQKSKKNRLEEKMFIAEGLRICLEAVRCNLCQIALMTENFVKKNPEKSTKISQKSKQCFTIDERLCSKISQTQASQGVFCLCTLLDKKFTNDKIKTDGRYILLSSLQDPGNIGTIIRGADAFSIDGVILSSDCPDIYSPKVLRSTMGGAFRENIMVCEDIKEAICALRDKGIKVFSTALYNQSVNVNDVDLTCGCAVVIGNEGNGLSADVIDICDGSIIIPMNPKTESLNAAAATTVIMWEMFRQSM